MSLCTIRGVCEDKVLQLRPLCGKSSDELEGVHRVPQEPLRVSGGCRRDDLQFVCPSGLRHKSFISINVYTTASVSFNAVVHDTHQSVLLFDLGEFVLLSADVVLQRGDQILLSEQQVGHVTCTGHRLGVFQITLPLKDARKSSKLTNGGEDIPVSQRRSENNDQQQLNCHPICKR